MCSISSTEKWARDVLGNPETPYLAPRGLPWPSASTFAMITLSLEFAKASASCSYIGAKVYESESIGVQSCLCRATHLAVTTVMCREGDSYASYICQ
jgi:hypothetical protein